MTGGISLAIAGIWQLYDSMEVTALGIDLAFLKVQKTIGLVTFGLAALDDSLKFLFITDEKKDAIDKNLKDKIANLRELDAQILTTEITLMKFQKLARNPNKNKLVDTTDVDFMKEMDKFNKALGNAHSKGAKTKKDKDPIGDRYKALQDQLEMMGRITKQSQIQGEIENMTRIRKKKATKEDLKAIALQIDIKKRLLDSEKLLEDFRKSGTESQDARGKAYQDMQKEMAKYNDLIAIGAISQKEFNTLQTIHMEEYNSSLANMTDKTQELTGFIKELHGAMDGFSQTSAEGLVDMTELLFQSGKGWQDFGDIVKDVIKGIARDIAVMGTKEFVTNPLFDMLKGGVSSMQGSDGGGSTYMGDAVQMGLTGLSSASAPSAAPAPSFRPKINSSSRVNIVNVIDPGVVGEYLNTKEGEDTMVNVLSTSDTYKAI